MIVILGLVILVETAAVSADRDDLAGQRESARAYTARDEQRNFTVGTPGADGAARNGGDPGPRGPSLSAPAQ